MVERERIELMDISPNQLVSVSASLIPFLENDDANRALMGSNMQRQAVPLLMSEAPLVGTGIEGVVARDSGVAIVAKRDGVVVDVDAARIVIGMIWWRMVIARAIRSPYTIYQNLCAATRIPVLITPDLTKGERITKVRSLPTVRPPIKANWLGKNVTVAFMPWGGYNFEDSILVSERLVRDGVYTSIHIEEFEVVARDTKLGKEETSPAIFPMSVMRPLKIWTKAALFVWVPKSNPVMSWLVKSHPRVKRSYPPKKNCLRAIFRRKGRRCQRHLVARAARGSRDCH